jgi:transcription elongation factor Elf1
MCNHENFKVTKLAPFLREVSIYPYTQENRAAHGNITETQECLSCGATRTVNVNQLHMEYSPWGESAEEKRQHLEKIAREELEKKQKMEADPKTVRHPKYGTGRVIEKDTIHPAPALKIDFGQGIGIKTILVSALEITG